MESPAAMAKAVCGRDARGLPGSGTVSPLEKPRQIFCTERDGNSAAGPNIGCDVRRIILDAKHGLIIGDIFGSHIPHHRRMNIRPRSRSSTSPPGSVTFQLRGWTVRDKD